MPLWKICISKYFNIFIFLPFYFNTFYNDSFLDLISLIYKLLVNRQPSLSQFAPELWGTKESDILILKTLLKHQSTSFYVITWILKDLWRTLEDICVPELVSTHCIFANTASDRQPIDLNTIFMRNFSINRCHNECQSYWYHHGKRWHFFIKWLISILNQ